MIGYDFFKFQDKSTLGFEFSAMTTVDKNPTWKYNSYSGDIVLKNKPKKGFISIGVKYYDTKVGPKGYFAPSIGIGIYF